MTPPREAPASADAEAPGDAARPAGPRPPSATSEHTTADWATGLLALAGLPVRPDMKVLDFGCGSGGCMEELRARGIEAFGCDVGEPAPDDPRRRWVEDGTLRIIDRDRPYRIPFEDATFDLAFSNQVFEHVMDYDATLAELHRVLRPGGKSLHVFPGPLTPIEGHTYVPLATVWRSRLWLGLWALVGVRNEFQDGKSWREVRDANHRYLREETIYLSRSAVRRHAERWFDEVRFVDDLYLSKRWPRAWARLRRVPPLRALGRLLVGELYMRALVLGRAP